MAKPVKFLRVDIEDIKPYENNAKIHSDDQIDRLAKSISEFGFVSPCLIDKDNNLIAGHGRLLAAKKNGLKDIPCVYVEGLTEEQKRAYILADNKLAEFSKWDPELLGIELQNINEIDFDFSGFDIADFEENLEDGYFGDERQRTNNAYNLDIANKMQSTDDFWQMPVIENDGYTPKKLIGFNYAKTSKEKGVGIHFFLDDYQFERIWNDPHKYIETLREYDCILSPDFSLYMDMPMPMKIWNTYRSRMIGQFYQSYGIKVIPTISWAEEATFKFAFSGIPKGSIVAISTIGVKEDEEALKIWKNGVSEMIKSIKPSKILVYGGKLDFDYGKTKVIYYDNDVLKRWKEND